MTQRDFPARAWSALSVLGDHFARMGGGARYPGFSDTHPPLLVALVIVAELSNPGLLHRFRSNSRELRDVLAACYQELLDDLPGSLRELDSLPILDEQRYPDALLESVIRHLTETADETFFTDDDWNAFSDYVASRLSAPADTTWAAFVTQANYIKGLGRS